MRDVMMRCLVASTAVLAAAVFPASAESDRALRALSEVSSISLEYVTARTEQEGLTFLVFETSGAVLDYTRPEGVSVGEHSSRFEVAWRKDGDSWLAAFVAPTSTMLVRSPYFRFPNSGVGWNRTCNVFPEDLVHGSEKFLGYEVLTSAKGGADVELQGSVTKRIIVRLLVLYVPRDNSDAFSQTEAIVKVLDSNLSDLKAPIETQLGVRNEKDAPPAATVQSTGS